MTIYLAILETSDLRSKHHEVAMAMYRGSKGSLHSFQAAHAPPDGFKRDAAFRRP